MTETDNTERIDATALSDERQLELAQRMIDGSGGVNHILELRGDALLDRVEPQTFTTDLHGDTLAEALGRAYSLRDSIEEKTDLSVSCEPTGTEYEFPSTVFFEIRVTIEENDD